MKVLFSAIKQKRKRILENQHDTQSLEMFCEEKVLVPQEWNATFRFLLPSQWFLSSFPQQKYFPSQSYVCWAPPEATVKLKHCAPTEMLPATASTQGKPSPVVMFLCWLHRSTHGSVFPQRSVLRENAGATVPSQDRPWEVTPERLSLHTLQKVGRAWEQAYQLCIPEKCSTLNWAT